VSTNCRQLLELEGVADEWPTFPGGELAGKRPHVRCPACLRRAAAGYQPHTLCFGCYRASVAHDRALASAARVDTGSEARFQTALPFEPVNQARLDALRRDRAAARTAARDAAGRFDDRRRRAQIEARHVLARIAAGVGERRLPVGVLDAAVHAADLQLPEAWLPFVCSR
jgi:hypothetical protein